MLAIGPRIFLAGSLFAIAAAKAPLRRDRNQSIAKLGQSHAQ